MASNFKIVQHPNSDNLHLMLRGIFDGSSAMELIYTIENHIDDYQRIFIHTCGLEQLLPFGEAVFVKHCQSAGIRTGKLTFTGDFSREMAVHSTIPAGASFWSEGGEACCH